MSLFWLTMVAFPTWGQSSDEVKIRAVLDHLFEGMRQSDSVMVRQTFAHQARLNTIDIDENTTVRQTSLSQFLSAVGTPHEEVWDEQLTDCKIRVDGPLATAWAPYRFYRGTTFSHCGVNAFQLYRSPTGWKILQITDTRRTEECKE